MADVRNEAFGDDSGDETDDEDYVPTDGESVSEEENSGDEEDVSRVLDDDTDGPVLAGKSRKHSKTDGLTFVNPRLRRLPRSEFDPPSEQHQLQQTKAALEIKAVHDKSRSDALWASFLSDTTPSPKSKQKNVSANPSAIDASISKDSKTEMKSNSTKVYEFAGEEVRFEKAEIPKDDDQKSSSLNSESAAAKSSIGIKRPGGLDAVLGFISKKQKISTLDKSKLDWEQYKREQGLSEELNHHSRSKNSYLDKKDFLERADQRQFEKERDIRLSASSKRK